MCFPVWALRQSLPAGGQETRRPGSNGPANHDFRLTEGHGKGLGFAGPDHQLLRGRSATQVTAHRFRCESVTMRVKPFIVCIADAEGATATYVFRARTRRRAERDVREWCKRTDWGATIVAIESARFPGSGMRGHRLLRVASITFAVSGITIATTMIVGLTLEGAL